MPAPKRAALPAIAVLAAFAACDKGPALHACEPDFGSPGGGDDVLVVGRGFAPGVTVAFAGRKAKVGSVRDDVIEVKSPPAPQLGPADVTVTFPDGSALLLRGGYTYREARLAPE